MRTTISLDDRLAERVKQRAASLGLSVSAFVAQTLDDSLKRVRSSSPAPFRLVSVGGPGLQPGIDLDRPNALVTTDDEATFTGRRER